MNKFVVFFRPLTALGQRLEPCNHALIPGLAAKTGRNSDPWITYGAWLQGSHIGAVLEGVDAALR